jgi:methyl-accepting chemotaxis protein
MFGGNNTAYEAQIRELKTEVERLRSEKSSLETRNSELFSKNSTLEQSVKQLEDENHGLKHDVSRLNNELLRSSDTSSASTLDKIFAFENESLKKGIVEIQTDLNESTNLSRDALSSAHNITQVFSKSSNELKSIMEKLLALGEDSQKVNKIIGELELKAKDIGVAIQVINDIVLQINILSLNASVEAASAGEAGKGFAVVAQEVKILANKTSDAAQNIESIVKSIQDSVKLTNSTFDVISTDIEDISTRSKSYSTEMGDAKSLTAKSFSDLGYVTDRVFMSLAKLDHVLWKNNTYLSLAHKQLEFNFVDHHNCRLGKWYEEGMGKRYFSKTPSYHMLERPHSLVHNSTHRVLDCIDDNGHVDYDRAFEALSEMEHASTKVFEILDKILHEKQ